ncbi:MAG: tRNA epoxyqueuosine(34) reductase QueG [Acidimicrobiia bacterium]|nr:tRNA epoxyqueuosine(34) reductase QueG [Acidimicrobiia bacterium]MBV9285099.1 tRNA epoxyqueuosine(34) reductase QueG [Acidimicrobiia bacterium]
MTSLWERVRAVALDAGLDALGVARAEPFAGTRRHLVERKAAGLHAGMHFTYGNPERSTSPESALPGARSLVVGARSYRAAVPHPPTTPAGRVARYSWRDNYEPVRRALGAVADVLTDEGHRAVVLVDDNRLVDREAAVRAGLGWYGKNTNVLLADHGSLFVLGSVVTDAVLPAGIPVADGCGTCARCLPACPTGALVAPGVLDARRCLAHLLQAEGDFPLEFREALGDHLYGCDDCQDVCPPNRLEDRRNPPPAAGDDDEAWVPVLDILDASDEELLARHGRWYIPRRQPRYLRRNALVVLGNVGDGNDPEVEAALRRALADPDRMLRSHAAWAAERLGRPDLVAAS